MSVGNGGGVGCIFSRYQRAQYFTCEVFRASLLTAVISKASKFSKIVVFHSQLPCTEAIRIGLHVADGDVPHIFIRS